MSSKGFTRNRILELVRANPRVSMRELCRAVHMQNASNIQYHLSRLEEEGLIHWEGSVGTKKSARSQRQSKRWQRGDVTLRRMSKAEEQARIDAVVEKAISRQQLAGSQSEDVIRKGEGWVFRPIRASRVG